MSKSAKKWSPSKSARIVEEELCVVNNASRRY